MKSFKEFIQLVYERVGDPGNPPIKKEIKCGPEGKVKYPAAPGGEACKKHRPH